MKVFNTEQIKAIDHYTVQQEQITSLQLMERAAKSFVIQFEKDIPDKKTPVCVFCGNGDNGGDGLAIARLLLAKSRTVKVFIFPGNKKSPDCLKNLKRLQTHYKSHIQILKNVSQLEKINPDTIIIDCIFGTGLRDTLTQETLFYKAVECINNRFNHIISVDIPSGLPADRTTDGISITANKTYSFQFPKLAFFLPENEKYVGDFQILNIGLKREIIEKTKTPYFFTTLENAHKIIKSRKKFSHKGSLGHALLVVGSYGKAGAAILSAKGCMRSGVGLTTAHIPETAYSILQSSIPEVMCDVDKNKNYITEIPIDDKYSVYGIGPGIGTDKKTSDALQEFLGHNNKPIILDADAINILSKRKKLLGMLPKSTILTPHPKEFERLVGRWDNDSERLTLQREFSKKHHLIIVLKGAHTSISDPDGNIYFNSTGNSGMATAGTGDVLTGIITGLLAQHYTPLNSAILGVYIHGLAADLSLSTQSEESLIASDITNHMGMAFKQIRGYKIDAQKF